MSISKTATAGLGGSKTGHLGSGRFVSSPWTRPADWVALPTVTSSDNKFVGLYAVYNSDSNFVALSAAGNYTVDWGDGTATENIATGVQANHNFVFSALGSGTLTSGGYRQAVITVTMQAGQTFTSLNLNLKHSQANLGAYNAQWLDARMAGSSVSSLTIGSTTATPVGVKSLQQFEYIGTSAITSFSNLFNGCRSLYNVIGTTWTTSGTTFITMFSNCSSLQTVSLLNTIAGTTFSGMFISCSSLQTVPLFPFKSTGTIDFSSMFASCVSLQTIPLFNTVAGTNFSFMFQSCSSLQTVPLFNTIAGTTFISMFNGCSSLQTVPLFNTISSTNFSQMFQNCFALQTVPLLNTVANTTFSQMFLSCSSLKTVPLFNTIAGTTFSNMFSGCSSLQTVPLFPFKSTGTIDFSSMFSSCVSLQTIPLFNTVAGTNFGSMFGACFSLQVVAMSGTSKTISYTSLKLSATEINNIYTNLASGVTAQTVTTSANWGTATSTASIATGKGWTVA